ncbi:MAG: hypothetical protein ACI8VE_002035, partial [Natrialbaceae archaeon]
SPRRNLLAVGLLLIGILHLVVPGSLLQVSRVLYDRLLAAEFSPRDQAPRRVRLIGPLMCLAGAVVWWS